MQQAVSARATLEAHLAVRESQLLVLTLALQLQDSSGP